MKNVIFRRAPLESHRSASRPSTLLRIVFLVALLFNFGAFVLQLEMSGDDRSPSLLLRLILAGSGILGLATIFSSPPENREILKKCKPIIYLILLALVSTLWSTSPSLTLKACITYFLTSAFALALPVRFGDDALPVLIQSMTLGCLLSIVWVFKFPQTGVHHAYDAFQSVHAGLWRGVFTHKQGLGTFAGFTVGLLLFYGRLAFSNILLRIGAFVCAVACLLGSQSATGLVVAFVFAASLYISHLLTELRPSLRKSTFFVLVVVILGILGLFQAGALSFIPLLLGKSADLTGRDVQWQAIAENFSGEGVRAVIGGGYQNEDFRWTISKGVPIDSGYYLNLIDFGYAGSLVLIAIYGRIFVASARLLFRTSRKEAALAVFPISALLVVIVYSITETGLLERHVSTEFIALAVYITASKGAPALMRTAPPPMARGRALQSAPNEHLRGRTI